jgi:sugar diacid utilization regulator
MLELDDPAVRPAPHVELVTALREGTVDEHLMRSAGLPAGGNVTVIAAVGEPAALREVVVAEAVAGQDGDPLEPPVAAWASLGDETIAVLAGPAGSAEERPRLLEWSRHCAKVLSGLGGSGAVSVGVADPVRAAGLCGALEQARHTAALAQPRPGGVDIAEPDHLVSHRMLLAAVPADVSRAFRTRVLDPLLEYDARHRSDLLPTLRRFLECDGSWRQCAASLHLHVNTVRYRMRRVEELTGRDLRNPLDRMDLALAVSLE